MTDMSEWTALDSHEPGCRALRGSLCRLSCSHSMRIHLAGGPVPPVVFWGWGPGQHSQAFPCQKQPVWFGSIARCKEGPLAAQPILDSAKDFKGFALPGQLSLSTKLFFLVHTLSHGIRQTYTVPVHAPSQPWHQDITVSFLVSPWSVRLLLLLCSLPLPSQLI